MTFPAEPLYQVQLHYVESEDISYPIFHYAEPFQQVQRKGQPAELKKIAFPYIGWQGKAQCESVGTNSSTHPTKAAHSSDQIHFSPNPSALSGASMETLVGPGTMESIPIPSVTTVNPLGSPIVSTELRFSTRVLSGVGTGSTTMMIQTFPAIITERPTVTLGPGEQVVGTMPTSASQPGFIPPVFNTNPVPPPGATELLSFSSQKLQKIPNTNHKLRTFTGASGYSTVVPVPTSSSSTILIGGLFGGGSIVLGAGGTIIGALPDGMDEVGGIHLGPIPPPGPPDGPPQHSVLKSDSKPSLTSPSSSATPSSSQCPSRPNVGFCGATCDSDDPSRYFYESDADDDDDAADDGDGAIRRSSWTNLIRTMLEKRAEVREITGCKNVGNAKYPKLTSKSKNGVPQFQRSGGHKYFHFARPQGDDFDILNSTVPGKKPPRQGYITEHLFEFQIFSRFMTHFLAQNGETCGGIWFRDFYTPSLTPEAQLIVNRIDNVDNMVYTNDYINTAKKLIFADAQNLCVDTFKSSAKWAVPAARAKVEYMMKGLGAVPKYLDENADAIKNTANEIVGYLQTYEKRTGTRFSPPMAVQFYDFYVSEINDYNDRGKRLGTNLANAYNLKGGPNRTQGMCIWANMPVMAQYPTMSITSFIPPAPLCFPDGSVGRIVFRSQNNPNLPGTAMNNRMTITDATAAAGSNIKVNLQGNMPANQQGWNYTPTQMPGSACQGVYVMEAQPPAPRTPLWDFDCGTRRLNIAGSVSTLCAETPPLSNAPSTVQYYCATSQNALQACLAQSNVGNVLLSEATWEPQASLDILHKCSALKRAPARRPHYDLPAEMSHNTLGIVAPILRTRPKIRLILSKRASHKESAFGSLIYIEWPKPDQVVLRMMSYVGRMGRGSLRQRIRDDAAAPCTSPRRAALELHIFPNLKAKNTIASILLIYGRLNQWQRGVSPVGLRLFCTGVTVASFSLQFVPSGTKRFATLGKK
ncbi:hypothetical protein B0H19DRAFT_1072338 [Mycena capillaripes]|nr:hypothetical protein B0H19DRAFT_1072338 [Mycena capillaripes]